VRRDVPFVNFTGETAISDIFLSFAEAPRHRPLGLRISTSRRRCNFTAIYISSRLCFLSILPLSRIGARVRAAETVLESPTVSFAEIIKWPSTVEETPLTCELKSHHVDSRARHVFHERPSASKVRGNRRLTFEKCRYHSRI